ncbi:iron-containing alcohol dehydrogenase [Caldibacillus thermoamylovorans]|uniref:iron-containing alcohol dehydrogenase n=1 Tax=Caldibacillus thermoamylovorans TaxID=35841 RepID=UPI00203BD3C1|nr:iron-containing alcohol dehydrogenase [Caldibacillus thermoamylovorans]MCM3054708.1 iron-containing alcohol dehydrogenase [Caldibacillus thermoamylovorans]
MENFSVFRTPQTIIYGRHALNEAAKESASRGTKALVISDHVMENLGYVSNIRNDLSKVGVESAIYLGVKTEPTDIYVEEALNLLKSENCDVVISLGGGSCIDTAKAVAVLAKNGGYIGDYMGGKTLASQNSVPHIAIPTTAGTGSEATDATIITNTKNDVKMMIKQPVFMPDVAIVDPMLTISSPKSVTAATGVDALSHAIEAYISRRAHPMTDKLALSAMELIVGNLLAAYEDGNNLEAREAMSLGSLQAGMAFSNASVCLVHGMSRPIGALFHVPHGFSNAMLLPAVLEFSKAECIDRLADLGRYFDPQAETVSNEEAAEIAVSSVKKLCLDLNIPNLKGWGIDQQRFESVISKMAEDALASGSPQNNPRIPSKEEIMKLYLSCYTYNFANHRVSKLK